MPVPKSVTTVHKNGNVEFRYISNCLRVQYTIQELMRGALRDVGKYIRKMYNVNFYSQLNKRTGKGGKNCQYWVRSKAMDLQVGLAKRTNKSDDGFWAKFYETGSSKTPKLDILRNTVLNNTDMIQKIESQYLTALSQDNPSLSGLSEGDYEDEE